MIIDVKKHLILGAKEDLDTFFDRAQERGVIEFIPTHARKASEVPLQIRHLIDAMRVLRKLPVKKPYLGGGDLQLADETAIKILDLKREVERLSEEKRLVELEIVRVSPFGDFSLADIDFIEKEGIREIQFFCMKTEKAHHTNLSPDLIYIGSDYDLDYFIAINDEPKSYPDMIEMRIDRPLGDLQTHLSFVK
ncbi:MAG: V-type ATP synthase subunit I, partial [Candidatus Melainabacteria bacterium]|nr:V-type ATP synthase subunit I [Candidatus Melainabacteria bacterium]